LADLLHYEVCCSRLTGSGSEATPVWRMPDPDGGGDDDQADFAKFQAAFEGL